MFFIKIKKKQKKKNLKNFLDTATPPQLSTDILLFSYFVIKTDAIQMSLQNICFLGEVMKSIV